MKKYLFYLFSSALILFLFSCDPAGMKTGDSAVVDDNSDFEVIGYVFWSPGKGSMSSIPYEYLTTINWAFAIPAGDSSGNLMPMRNPDTLRSLVRNAHEHGVKVLVSVGGFSIGDGPGIDTRFELLANSQDTRTNFARSSMEMVREFDLDGVDIDWEFPDPEEPSASNFVLLMKELRDSLQITGKKLTTAVESHHLPYVYGVKDEIFDIVDWVNIMAYDNEGIGSHRPHLINSHSPFWLAIESFDYWVTKRGLPKEKAVLGVPFYGKGTGKGGSYRSLLARGADPYADVHDSIFYNGIKTMQEKTRFAKEKGRGIMIWEISGDTTGEYSLLKAIHDARKE